MQETESIQPGPEPEPGAVAEQIDWWVLEYVDLSSQLVCPICHTAFVQPVSTDCGHTFCRQCIESIQEICPKLYCPIDRKPVEPESLKPAPFLVGGLVNDLVVRCPHSGQGCTFEDKRWLLQTHIDLHCEHALVECRDGCNQLAERRWFTEGKCPHQLVKCPNGCSEELALESLDKHLIECPNSSWECPHCQQTFLKNEKADHEQECDQAPEKCPGWAIGCPFSETKEHHDLLQDHAAACPLALLKPHLARQDKKIGDLEREVVSLRRQLETTKRQVKRDASNIDVHIMMEYERLRKDVDHNVSQNESTFKQVMLLSRETARMNDELGFTLTLCNNLRRQMHASRRFSMFPPWYPPHAPHGVQEPFTPDFHEIDSRDVKL